MIVRDIDELINALQAVKDKTTNLPLNPYMNLEIVSIKQKNGLDKTFLHFDKTFLDKDEDNLNSFTDA